MRGQGSPREPGPLKLLAQDADDLKVISAAVQDAVCRIGDIRYEPGRRLLTLALNRYRWEGVVRRERVRAALQFADVLEVKARGIRREASEAVLALLAVTFEATGGEDPGGVVALTFAGGGDLRLRVEAVEAALADVSGPWPARSAPHHDSAVGS